MSCNSAIYTANTGEQALLAGAQIPFGSIIRRFGRYVNINGSDIVIGDEGATVTNMAVRVEKL